MVEIIYDVKNKVLEHMEEEVGDMQRANTKELGELADIVKDLAEAEKSCWEASYYKLSTESLESSGYDGASMSSRSGYSGQGSSGRSSYGNRSGYHGSNDSDMIEALGEQYRNLSPDERMAMKHKVLATLGIK